MVKCFAVSQYPPQEFDCDACISSSYSIRNCIAEFKAREQWCLKKKKKSVFQSLIEIIQHFEKSQFA